MPFPLPLGKEAAEPEERLSSRRDRDRERDSAERWVDTERAEEPELRDPVPGMRQRRKKIH